MRFHSPCCPPFEEWEWLLKKALEEDFGVANSDLSASLIDASQEDQARIIAREEMVLCGREWVNRSFSAISGELTIQWHFEDGDRVDSHAALCAIRGPSRAIVSGERIALNGLQTLSATATTTRNYVDCIAHTECRLLDTRKTLPGWRALQKYAVRCGGGNNHRMGLYDAVLLKENHIAACGRDLAGAVARAKRHYPDAQLIVEVEDCAALETAIIAGVNHILLDNFSIDGIAAAARIAGGRCRLEASGNISLDNIARIADAGVNFVSVGALTRNLKAIDLSLLID